MTTRELNSFANRELILSVALLLALAFCLAAKLGPPMEQRLVENGAGDDDVMARWLGDSRRMFANSFFIKADAYFHSGYYPTIYDDNAPFKTPHIGEDSGAMESKNSGDEDTVFGHPHNWVERFELNFFPSRHTHLSEGGADGEGATAVKEILPWLKISQDLDKHRIETYTVTAYWLRKAMHKVDDAEQVLREGLRANPGNAVLLFGLGQIYQEDRNRPETARNLYLAALAGWNRESSKQQEQDKFYVGQVYGALATLEEHEGNNAKAVKYLKLLENISPSPDAIQKHIDELEQNHAAQP